MSVEWQIADRDEDGVLVWKDDPKLKITCVKQMNHRRPKHQVSSESGPVAQPYIQIEPVEQGSSYSTGAVAFGCISMVLLSLMIAIFGRRFHRAWGRGATGKQLLFETLDIFIQEETGMHNLQEDL